MTTTTWTLGFLQPPEGPDEQRRALIILNQPFSFPLLDRLWKSTSWHCCADGGANRLQDLLTSTKPKHQEDLPRKYLPNLIKGDLDSIRPNVRDYYASLGVTVERDEDQDSTDLMKCVEALQNKEIIEGRDEQYDIIILGGLSGRLDQTIHTLSYLHKLRTTRKRVYVITDDNVAWVLDEGSHVINIDHNLLGPTCGLLPVGVGEATISTRGLRWNITNQRSSFDGLVSTSNHLIPEECVVSVDTSAPIWWTVELRRSGLL